MAVGRISGPLLKSNLLRDGVDLAFETDLLYLDVTNGRIGIKNATPGYELDVTGTTQTTILRTGQALIDNVEIDGSNITTSVGDLNIDPATATDRVNIGPATIPNIYGNVLVDGTLTATGDIIANGDIVLGNENTDSVSFVADVDSNIIPNIDDTYTLGNVNQRWLEGHFADLFVDGVSINTAGGSVPLLSDEVNKIYVHLGGSDSAGDGTNTATAFRTIKHALSQATAGDTVVISPGVFEEAFPLTVPAGVSVNGSGIRATTIKPTSATQSEDGFYLNGETTVQNLSVVDMFYNSSNDTGYAFQFAPGATITTRSPYVKEVSVLNKGSVTTSTDPFGFAQGDAGRGIKVDGSVLAGASLEPAMLFTAITLIVPNSVGLELTNGARVEWLNSFVYFADIGIDAYEGTLGRYSNGKTYIELAGVTGTPAAGDNAVFTSTDGSTVVTVTVESVNGNTIILDGRVDDFEGFDFTPASITFSPSGATATSITRYDRKEFGAEIRSISSANIYGTRGIRASGADVRIRLSSHDFGYIGSGGDFSNNDNLVNTSNQVIELDEGRVFYSATDQYGDYRIGNLFLVDQDTGAVTFTGGQFDVSSLTGITFTDGSNTTIVNPTKVETGNIRISGNSIESLDSNITISAFNNEIVVDSNQTVTGTLDVNGQSTLASVNVEDLTDNRIVIAGTSGELEDDANFTFDGTTFNIGATGELTVDVATGNTQIKGTLNVDDQATIASLNVEDLTSGRVVLAGTNGEIEDSANLTFDGTLLTVTGNQSVTGTLDVDTSATIASLNVEDLTSGRVVLAGTNGEIEDSANLTFDGTLLTVTGNQSITGTLDVDTSATIATLNVEDLTDNRIVIAGTNGEIEDDANFTFDGATFNIGATGELTVDVATGNTQIKGTLNVDGQAAIASLNVEDLTSGRVVITGTGGELADDANFTWNGTLLNVTGDVNVSNGLTAPSIFTSLIDSTDSSAITVTPATIFSSDVAVQNNLTVTSTSIFNDAVDINSTLTVQGLTQFNDNVGVTGTLDVDSQATVASLNVEDLTSGRVVLAGTNGEIEDSANLTFDGSILELTGSQTITGTLNVDSQATVASLNVEDLTPSRITFAGTNGELVDSDNIRFNGTSILLGPENGEVYTIDTTTGNTQVLGTINIDSQATVASLNVEDLTNGRVLLAGISGEVEDSGNLTFNGSTLTVTGDVDVTGNVTIGGNITIGDAETDAITVAADFESHLIPDIDITYDLGSASKRWNNIYGNSLSTVVLQGGNIKVSTNVIENVSADESIVIRPNGTGILDIDSSTAISLPTGGDAERPVIAEEGQIRYNTTSERIENYNSENTWISLATEDDAIAFSIALG